MKFLVQRKLLPYERMEKRKTENEQRTTENGPRKKINEIKPNKYRSKSPQKVR